MSIDDDLHERLEAVFGAISPQPAPIDDAIRGGRVIKGRRRLALAVDAGAVAAAAAIAVPSVLRHTAAPGPVAPAQPHIKAGTLRGLAVCADARWADLPDVPTMIESGYPDFVFATDAMLLAPAKTPPEVVKWLETETLKVLNTQEMKDKMFQNGFLVRPKGAAACWARATKEMDTFKQIIDQAGIKKL